MTPSFALDWSAVGLAALFLALFFFLRKRFSSYPTPHIKYSKLDELQKETSPWQKRKFLLPRFLQYVALGSFLLAFLDPRFLLPKTLPEGMPSKEPLEGIAIYFILDQSSSMEEKIPITLPDGSHLTVPKIKLLKEVTSQFVRERPNDLIGLIGFARGAQVLDPLTLDHQAILEELAKLEVQKAKEQAGTSIGYAIYKTANLIVATRHYAEDLQGEGKPAYAIKSSIMILVTDGVPEANPLDVGKRLRTMSIPDAAAYAKQEEIRLYIINIDPAFVRPDYEPFRKQMKEATESTGGKFFVMSTGTTLQQIYSDINKLEKTLLPGQEEILGLLQQRLSKDKLPNLYQRVSLYPFLIAFGLVALLGYLLLESTWLRKVP